MKMKKFVIHWTNKTTTNVEGYDIADAFRRAGFGGGFLRAVDYWEKVKAPKPGRRMTFKDIEWNFDPAASGNRLRAFLKNGELIAYEDGNWAVLLPMGHMWGGKEKTQAKAQKRAFKVWTALTEAL